MPEEMGIYLQNEDPVAHNDWEINIYFQDPFMGPPGPVLDDQDWEDLENTFREE